MDTRQIIAADLSKIANKFDECGMEKEAEELTDILVKIAQIDPMEDPFNGIDESWDVGPEIQDQISKFEQVKEQVAPDTEEYSDEDIAPTYAHQNSDEYIEPDIDEDLMYPDELMPQ